MNKLTNQDTSIESEPVSHQAQISSPDVIGLESPETQNTTSVTQEEEEIPLLENDVAIAQLNQEKSLAQIWRHSWRLETTRFNIFCLLTVVLPLVVYVFSTKLSISDIATLTRTLSDFCFSFATSILGFLLAGFTIFATLSRPKMFVEMARFKHPSRAGNTLKYSFFLILNVFIIYLSFVTFCLIIKVFAFPAGPFTAFVGFLPFHTQFVIKWIVARFGFIAIASLFWASVFSLKSFIYNIYKIVMLQVTWDIANPNL